MKDALLHLGGLAVAAFVFRMWLQDYRAFGQMLAERDDSSPPRDPVALADDFGGMPGATPVGRGLVAVAVIGALAILGVEVAGEYSLGVAEEQTSMTVIFGFYTLAAAFWVQVWELRLSLTPKSIFSTSILFFNSLWFYFVRFFRMNPYRSLLPCFAAHFTSNLGVFAIKALQGKVEGFY